MPSYYDDVPLKLEQVTMTELLIIENSAEIYHVKVICVS